MNKKEIEKLYVLKINADATVKFIEKLEAKKSHKFNKTQYGNKRYYEGIRTACEILSK